MGVNWSGKPGKTKEEACRNTAQHVANLQYIVYHPLGPDYMKMYVVGQGVFTFTITEQQGRKGGQPSIPSVNDDDSGPASENPVDQRSWYVAKTYWLREYPESLTADKY